MSTPIKHRLTPGRSAINLRHPGIAHDYLFLRVLDAVYTVRGRSGRSFDSIIAQLVRRAYRRKMPDIDQISDATIAKSRPPAAVMVPLLLAEMRRFTPAEWRFLRHHRAARPRAKHNAMAARRRGGK